LYANLARLNLPHAEAVFDISFFRQNPFPFYTLANELYPGKYRPTITHSFIYLLHKKSLLLKHFTQNIDCLDREAGVPGDMIIEAHGSFAKQGCIDCQAPYPDELMREAIEHKQPPHCQECDGLVKPAIVFFGEALPAAFHANRDLPRQADLCIVIGTSLTVQPFASLPTFVPEEVPRVLINLEQVGGLGSRPDDVLLLGDCDGQVKKLAEACGWLQELEELWKETAPRERRELGKEKKEQTKEESVEEEIEKLTREVGKSLDLAKEHDVATRKELEKEVARHVGGKTEKPASSGGIAATAVSGSKDLNMRSDDGLQHVFPHLRSNLS